MIRARRIAVILIVACLAGTATEATAAEPHGRAYLFRGMIDLIDWGMDQLAGRINRTGVAANIRSHLMWRSVADQAISDYRRDPKPPAHAGDTLQTIATTYHVPLWTLTQLNKASETAALTEGQRVVIPHSSIAGVVTQQRHSGEHD